MDFLNILMRALHVLSAVILVGGVLAWRFAAIPAIAGMRETEDAIAARWRSWVVAAVAGLLISGTYNFLRKTGLTPAWHAVFGVKVLLALHVFAVAILAARPGNARRARQLTGVAFSGVVIVILSAVLRWLSTR